MPSLVSTCLLLLSLTVRAGEAGILGASAAGGAASAAAGAVTYQDVPGGATFGRNATMDLITLLILGAFTAGLITTFISYWVVILFKRHFLKIADPPRSFVMEKNLKCTSGENRKIYCEIFCIIL